MALTWFGRHTPMRPCLPASVNQCQWYADLHCLDKKHIGSATSICYVDLMATRLYRHERCTVLIVCLTFAKPLPSVCSMSRRASLATLMQQTSGSVWRALVMQRHPVFVRRRNFSVSSV